MMLVKKGMVKKQCQSYKGVKILILLPGMHDIFLGKIQKNNLPHKADSMFHRICPKISS